MIYAFQILNYKGVVRLEAAPDGRSITLRGSNGSGKSSTVEGLLWALGAGIDGEPLRLGADELRVELRLRWNDNGDELLVTRAKKKGKKPTLSVRDVVPDGAPPRAPYASPSTLLERFLQAIGRNAFSQLPEKERVNLVRRLAPGLDVSDLDEERARVYAERTQIGREADELAAQARGVAVPEAPAEIEPERDLAAIAGKKAEIEKVRAANTARRAAAGRARAAADAAGGRVTMARNAVEAARVALRDAELAAEREEAERQQALNAAGAAEFAADGLIDPDPSDIDREIAAARQHNAAVRAAEQRRAERARAEAEAMKLAERAAARGREYNARTERLKAIDEQRAARIAGARCPIPGLALTADGVVYPGRNGPVPVPQLSTGERITLDVEVAASLGLRLIPVPGWGDLDREHRAQIDALAAGKGIQLFRELTTEAGPLEALIEEGAPAGDADDFT